MTREITYSEADGPERRWVLGDVDLLWLLQSIRELTAERESVVTLAAPDDGGELVIGIGDVRLRISEALVVDPPPAFAPGHRGTFGPPGTDIPQIGIGACADVMTMLRNG